MADSKKDTYNYCCRVCYDMMDINYRNYVREYNIMIIYVLVNVIIKCWIFESIESLSIITK